MQEKIKSWGVKIGFALSVLATLVLLFMTNRLKRKYADLRLEADRYVLQRKLEAIQEKAARSDADYSVAHGDYLRLKRAIPGVFERNGLPADPDKR